MNTEPASWTPEDEFWWLPPSVSPEQLYCRLAQNDPPGEEENGPAWRFAPHGSTAEAEAELLPVSHVPEWWGRWRGINLHRSLVVHLGPGQTEQLVGPCLLDIDGPDDQPHHERVGHAREVAVRAMDWLMDTFSLTDKDVRCRFSGAKGFHVEVRPAALGAPAHSVSDSTRLFQDIRRRLLLGLQGELGTRPRPSTNVVGEVTIDPAHDWVRLTNSINAWREANTFRAARVTPLTAGELRTLDAWDILARATPDVIA